MRKKIALGLILACLALASWLLSGCGLLPEPYTENIYKALVSLPAVVNEAVAVSPLVPKTVYQGDLLPLTLTGDADAYYATFNGKEFRFARRNDAFYGLVPVSYAATPGNTELQITKDKDGVLSHETYTVEILSKKFEEQSLVVSTTMQQTRSQDNLNKDAQKVLASKQEHLSYPLWKEDFMQPVETYRLSTSYGLVRKINGSISGRHSGMDMAAPRGTPVYAVNDGYVRLSEVLYVTGNTIVLDHGMALYSGYGHLDTLDVEAGEYVVKGQQIATVGTTGFSTGPHLHFTFTIGTTFVNPEMIFGETLIP